MMRTLIASLSRQPRFLLPMVCFGLLLWMPAKAEATAMSVHRVTCVSVHRKVSWKFHEWCSYGGGIGGCQLSMTLTRHKKTFNTYLSLSNNSPFRRKPFPYRFSMKFKRKKGLVHFQYWAGKKKVGGFKLRRIHKKKNLWSLQSRFVSQGGWARLKPFDFKGRQLVLRCVL